MSETVNAVVADGGDREADAVDGDRPLLDDVARQVAAGSVNRTTSQRSPGVALRDRRGAVDVALDDVPAEPADGRHGALEVDPVARAQGAEAGAARASRP